MVVRRRWACDWNMAVGCHRRCQQRHNSCTARFSTSSDGVGVGSLRFSVAQVMTTCSRLLSMLMSGPGHWHPLLLRSLDPRKERNSFHSAVRVLYVLLYNRWFTYFLIVWSDVLVFLHRILRVELLVNLLDVIPLISFWFDVIEFWTDFNYLMFQLLIW